MKRTILTLSALLILVVSSFAQSAANVLDKCLGAVVTVAVYQTEPYGKMTLGMRGEVSEEAYKKALDLTNAKGSGSGFVIKRGGKFYVITNAHVIESASTESGSIYVYTINQTKYEVRVLGGDNFYDLAVLEFVGTPGAEVDFVDFTKTEPRVGDKVYAIGNPLGTYPYTVTDGIISAKNRARGGLTGKFGFLQHTATLIWGNSGGPLVNEKGEVVGVNSQIAFASAPDGSQILQQQINFSLEPKTCIPCLYNEKYKINFSLKFKLKLVFVFRKVWNVFSLISNHSLISLSVAAVNDFSRLTSFTPTFSVCRIVITWLSEIFMGISCSKSFVLLILLNL